PGGPRHVPARENADGTFFRIAKIFAQNAGGIRVVHHVIAEEEIVLNNVPDEPAQKSNVAAGADWHPDVGQRTGARKSWINMNNCCAALFCFDYPTDSCRTCLWHRRAFDQYDI